MFNNLKNNFIKILNFNNNNIIDDKYILKFLKKMKNILIDSDVHILVIKKFIKRIKNKLIGKFFISFKNFKKYLFKIIYKELKNIIGNKTYYINLNKNKISLVLIMGFNGSGKTTFCGKLSNFLKKKNIKKKPLLVSINIYKEYAIKQLKLIGNKYKIDVLNFKKKEKPIKIIKNTFKYCYNNNYDLIIVDCFDNNEKNIKFIKKIKKIYKPDEILFVIDSMLGQHTINIAKYFYKKIKYNGIVLTKLDSNNKGGLALSIKTILNIPIKFITFGEKINDIDYFYPNRIVKRILDIGDLESLIEISKNYFNEKYINNVNKKINSNNFNFNDFLIQIEKIEKLENLNYLLQMIPGIGNLYNNKQIFVKIKSIIFSMTIEERIYPEILQNNKRKIRIAIGSGRTLEEVNNLIKNFNKFKKIILNIKNNNNYNILKEFLKIKNNERK